MKRYIRTVLLLLLIVTETACRSQQSTVRLEQDIRTEQEVQTERQTNIHFQQSMDKAVKETVDELFKKMIEMNWQQEKVNYSPPDSTGQQYLTSTEKSRFNQKTEESNQRAEQTDTHYKEATQQTIEINERLKHLETLLQKLDTERKSPFAWYHTTLQFLGVLMLVYLSIKIYIKLKKQ